MQGKLEEQVFRNGGQEVEEVDWVATISEKLLERSTNLVRYIPKGRELTSPRPDLVEVLTLLVVRTFEGILVILQLNAQVYKIMLTF